jgi:hypothetical protein
MNLLDIINNEIDYNHVKYIQYSIYMLLTIPELKSLFTGKLGPEYWRKFGGTDDGGYR